jgi:hypothetical protein
MTLLRVRDATEKRLWCTHWTSLNNFGAASAFMIRHLIRTFAPEDHGTIRNPITIRSSLSSPPVLLTLLIEVYFHGHLIGLFNMKIRHKVFYRVIGSKILQLSDLIVNDCEISKEIILEILPIIDEQAFLYSTPVQHWNKRLYFRQGFW